MSRSKLYFYFLYFYQSSLATLFVITSNTQRRATQANKYTQTSAIDLLIDPNDNITSFYYEKTLFKMSQANSIF